MIDFRYHLVSLISVFLALAVGIVLGAGPLQNSLGTALNEQVTSLREDRNSLKSRLEQTATALNERDEYIMQEAQSILPGTLSGKRVAAVALPEADEDSVESIITQLEAAGAVVDGSYALTDAWVDRSQEGARATYSAQVAAPTSTPSSTDTGTLLGEALGRALTTSDSALRSTLTSGSAPLVAIETEPTASADMIVVVGPPATDADGNASPQPSGDADASAWVTVLAGTASTAPTVVVGSADQESDVVSTIRSAEASVTTVDSVGQVAAAVSTPLALVSTAAGTIGHYGFDKGAEAVMPPVPG